MLENLNCSINPKNTKKGDHKSLEYAIAISETTGPNRNRPTNIKPNLNNLNFNNINHPLNEKDYKTSEKNNKLIQLMVYKICDKENELRLHNHNRDKNKRNEKVILILLANNHYIYVTKLNLLTKYINYD